MACTDDGVRMANDLSQTRTMAENCRAGNQRTTSCVRLSREPEEVPKAAAEQRTSFRLFAIKTEITTTLLWIFRRSLLSDQALHESAPRKRSIAATRPWFDVLRH